MILNPRTDILPDSQKKLWPLLTEVPKDFVLYGGTAVALRYGHRQSVDFDFFSSLRDDDVRKTTVQLGFIKHYAINYDNPEFMAVSSGSQVIYKLKMLESELVEVTFVRDNAFIGGSAQQPSIAENNNINIASPIDLMATKINALKNRKSVKDFVDISIMINNGVSFKRGITVAIAMNKNRLRDEIIIFNSMLQTLQNPEEYKYIFTNDRDASDELKDRLQSVINTMVPEAEKIQMDGINYKYDLKQSLCHEEDTEDYSCDR